MTTHPTVKKLRENATDAERKLWHHLRRKQVNDLRFRRQYRLGAYIVDFVCLPARLVIEVDGGQHDTQRARDGVRTAWLESQGFRANLILRQAQDEAHLSLWQKERTSC